MTALQYAVIAILDESKGGTYQWSLQGFGLLRLYVRDFARIHIWHSGLRYPGVSMIHNHSWDLASTIVSGRLVNTRYTPCQAERGRLYHTQRRITGYQTVEVGPVTEEWLDERLPEVYWMGDTYAQRANEIHLTDASDGTVTIMERKEDVEGRADIYWPYGTEWGTAKPRPATREELTLGITTALKIMGV